MVKTRITGLYPACCTTSTGKSIQLWKSVHNWVHLSCARGVPEDIIRCIQSHAPHTRVPREKPMDYALFAVDELTGMITACALVRPSKSLHDLASKSVRGKRLIATPCAWPVR